MKKSVGKTIKDFLKKFWFIVWKDDSIKGWIISIVFLFVVIKFIFFPFLSLATGTALPLAIVESCSMYHDGNLFSNFDNWWERHDLKYSQFTINKLDFEDFPFKSGLNKGDILFIVGVEPKDLKEGDVIIFNAGRQNPLIHRIIDIEVDSNTGKRIFSTIGDNNNGQLPIEEKIQENQIIGKATFKLAPYLGWGKLIFYEPSRDPSQRGLCHEN